LDAVQRQNPEWLWRHMTSKFSRRSLIITMYL